MSQYSFNDMGITHEMSPIYKYELIFVYSFISDFIMIHDIFVNTVNIILVLCLSFKWLCI